MACRLGAPIEGEVTVRNARILLTELESRGPEVHMSSRHGLRVCGSGTATDHCLGLSCPYPGGSPRRRSHSKKDGGPRVSKAF